MGKRLERSSRRPEEPVCVSVDILKLWLVLGSFEADRAFFGGAVGQLRGELAEPLRRRFSRCRFAACV